MTTDLQPQDSLTCPLCAGVGKITQTYKYKPQHRSDMHNETIQRLEDCPLCKGAGEVSQTIMDEWLTMQANPVCPLCKDQGGKRFWSWEEDGTGTRKVYTFEPCALCKGKQHISPDQLAVHARERRRLQFWGVGCTLLVVVGGIFIATQLVSVAMAQTPLLQCCAPPHIVFVTGMMVLSRKMRWL